MQRVFAFGIALFANEHQRSACIYWRFLADLLLAPSSNDLYAASLQAL